MFLQILGTLFPVFVTIFIGWILARTQFISKHFLDELNKFVYWITLPCLILSSLSNTGSLPKDALPSFMILLLASIILLVATFLFSKLSKMEKHKIGTFAQASFRGNLAFIGIPIIAYALRSEPQEYVNTMISQTVIIFAPTMIYYNLISVFLLVRSQNHSVDTITHSPWIQVAKNPLIISSIIGIVLGLLPWKLPSMVGDSLTFIGKIAAPAALLCVGGSIANSKMGNHLSFPLVASVFKIALLPIITWIICQPLDLNPHSEMIILVLAASPTAVASFIMAKQMNGDEELASNAIVMSTVFSPIILCIILAISG
jgi:predicted permease